MLGKIAQWFAARAEDREDEALRRRFDALTRLKIATLEVLQAVEDRTAVAQAILAEEQSGDALLVEEAVTGGLQSAESNERATPSAVALTLDDPCVHELCLALENCVKLGLKHSAEQDVSWWNVLYSSTLVVDEPALVESVVSAALLTEDDAGKERCWLKLALNSHTLEVSLMMIFSLACEQVIRSSYEEWSLIRCSEGLGLFLQMVIEIRSVNFAMEVSDEPFHAPAESATTTSETAVAVAAEIATEIGSLLPPPAPVMTTEEASVNENTPLLATAPSSIAELSAEPSAAALGEVEEEKSDPTPDGASSPPSAPSPPPEEVVVEVPVVNFIHRNKAIKPWQHVFGVSLAYLCKNPYHSRFALIDPVLAIPNLVQDCIDFLMDHPDTPRLFRATVLNVHISQLRDLVEMEGGLPPDLEPLGAGALLLDFFKNLPDPLLTSEKYDAFVASGRLRDEEASVRNLTCLVQELPVHCKFVLEKVIGLMHFLQLPEHAELNGVDAMTSSTALAPVIAFKIEPAHTLSSGQRRSTHSQYQDVRYAAVGAQVVERMIQHYDVIFQDVRVQVSDALKRLEAKKEALLNIHQLYKMKPQVNFMSDKQHLDEITILFTDGIHNIEAGESGAHLQEAQSPVAINELQRSRAATAAPLSSERGSILPMEDLVLDPVASDAAAAVDSLRTASGTDMSSSAHFRTASGTGTRIGVPTRSQTHPVASSRIEPYADPANRSLVEIWEKHGFNRSTVLSNFEKGGVLLLRAVAFMVKNYTDDVLPRLYERALPTTAGTSSFDAGLVASAICRSLINQLKLVPSPEAPHLNLVALSVEPFWELFDEEAYFFKLFVLMFHMFDQIWSMLDPQEASFTRVFCETEAKLDEILKRSPASVEEMRDQWEEMFQEMTHAATEGDSAEAVAPTGDGIEAVDGVVADGNEAAAPSSTAVTGPPSPPRFLKRPSFANNVDEYKTKLLDATGVLTLEQVAYLDHVLPLTCQLCRWSLLYSTEAHGSSLDTLLLLAKGQSPSLLVVKDEKGNVFGGFASDEWHRAAQYYGNGESFLFSFANAKGGSAGEAASGVLSFAKYPWSRKNSYFMLCSEESLVMGGGGSFGLYLDGDLSSGTTGPCETYNSRPLVGSQEFSCVLVELWGFTSSDRALRSSEPRKKSVLD